MFTTIDYTEMFLAIGSIIIVGAIVLFFKNILRKIRRPNGKKGGIISFHAAIAFAIVTAIALTTKDYFLTGLTLILAYLISRGRLEEGQHYMYQVILGAIFGIMIPFGIYYFYHKRLDSHESSSERESFEDKPEKAVDDRHEADAITELKLDDLTP